jgi:excisionase family DNA binding protein
VSEAAETVVLNPAYWYERSAQLARILAAPRGPSKQIGDPTGNVAAPDSVMAIHGSAHWGEHPDELDSALRRLVGPDVPAGSGGGVGVAPAGQERLTLTVEEAATMLGISRAFAYEAVNRGEIPHIRIGRRILVPRSALDRLLDTPST